MFKISPTEKHNREAGEGFVWVRGLIGRVRDRSAVAFHNCHALLSGRPISPAKPLMPDVSLMSPYVCTRASKIILFVSLLLKVQFSPAN